MVVVQMTASVGEPISVNIKAQSSNRIVRAEAFEWCFPRLLSPANVSPRGLRYIDNVPAWKGEVHVDGGDSLADPKTICFNEK